MVTPFPHLRSKEASHRPHESFSRGFVLTLGILAPGCVTQLRPVKGLSEHPRSKTVLITLDGVESADLSRPGLTFEISGCVSPTAGALLPGQNKIEVAHVELDSSMVCTVSLKTIVPEPTMVFLMRDQLGVLYQSEHVIISRDMNGQLFGRALLRKMYYQKAEEKQSEISR